MVSGVGWQGGDGEGGGAGSGAEGKKGVTQGRNKKELENKKKGGGKQAGALLVLLAPCCGASTVPSPSPPPASEEFGVSLSRKDRAASDTQGERPERRNPGAAPEVGEGRLAGSGAWCQEPGWRDMLGSTEGQGLRVEDPPAQAQVRSPGQSAHRD